MKDKLKIIKFCSPYLVTVNAEYDLPEVMTIMKEAGIRHVPVVNDGKPIGIISDRDLKVFYDKEFAAKFKASDIMIKDPFTVDEDCDLREVVDLLLEKKVGSCLVQKNDRITGIFTLIDALRTLKLLLTKDGHQGQLTIEY